VWKVNVADGDVVYTTKVVAILEAMKMEVAVSYDGDKKNGIDTDFRIEKVLVQPGDTVRAGDALVFLRNN
jgi:biotin carboxyl carrier protein